jgi:hypothetical protein
MRPGGRGLEAAGAAAHTANIEHPEREWTGVNRGRRAVLMLLAGVAVGCGQTSSQPPAAAPGGAEHRFVHVHEFPDMGARIAPPTGRPRLSWQQALQVVTRRHDGWDARTPPQVKLADYSSRTGEGPLHPVPAWIVVYPDANEASIGGPDFAPAAARVRGHCPAYVVVDATSGRGWGAFQTCQPPYRG